MQNFIQKNAQRKSYGGTPTMPDVYEDTCKDSLYYWEVVNAALVDGPSTKDINMIRAGRSLISDKIKCFEKVIELSQKATKTKHLIKIQTEIDRLYSKISPKITAHAQKEAQRVQVLVEKEQAEAEKIEKEKQKKLEAELKKQKEQEEKERKRLEAAKVKQQQEEAKRAKAEETKRKKEEAKLKKEEEELKRKQEQEALRHQKENQQKKLLSFFKKGSGDAKPSPQKPAIGSDVTPETAHVASINPIKPRVEIPDLTINLSAY